MEFAEAQAVIYKKRPKFDMNKPPSEQESDEGSGGHSASPGIPEPQVPATSSSPFVFAPPRERAPSPPSICRTLPAEATTKTTEATATTTAELLERPAPLGQPKPETAPESVPSVSQPETSDHVAASEGSRPPVANGTKRKRASPPWRPDEKDGHYAFELGDSLSSRYKILSKMGEGTFGRVAECWDREKKSYVAIKIIRNVSKYRDAAMIELDVLRHLQKHDPDGKYRCVQLLDWFDYRGHVCMVFEKLGLSLYDFLRKNRDASVLHETTLIHTDLKPENILLVSSAYTKVPHKDKGHKRVPVSKQIKLIDFGSATFDGQYHSRIVSTRHYRAPEVILGLGWSYPCDMWSIGCILIELVTGNALFQTHDNLEHLAMMERVLGSIPQHLASRADRHSQHYFRHHDGHVLNWPDGASSHESIRAVRRLDRLRDMLYDKERSPAMSAFADLLSGLLKYEPSERLKASEALNHPFFREQLSAIRSSDHQYRHRRSSSSRGSSRHRSRT
eukprot:jgi/Chlat1/7914/Chrsp68S00583